MNQDQAWTMFLEALASGDGPRMSKAMSIMAIIISTTQQLRRAQ